MPFVALGGIAAIAVSHPHYYTTMIEWSHAFKNAPVHIHKSDAKWVLRPDSVIQFWDRATKSLFGGLTLINTGGHFEGFQVCHWPAGASGHGRFSPAISRKCVKIGVGCRSCTVIRT